MVKKPSWPVDRFRELIDQILRDTGLPQVQLAALVPMDQSQLSRWKAGTSKPKHESLQSLGVALAEHYPHLGIGPDELINSVYPRDTGDTPAEDRMEIRDGSNRYKARPSTGIPSFDDIKDPTPAEAAMLAVLAAVHEDVRHLKEQLAVMQAERQADHDERERDGRNQKGA
ncbi:helix-turn-helix domain-containing protein [Nonomuraea rubra]|uniref:Transcriptional regulator with XRE-family HTH domain n=1 Tax=Nonomuraea rubra TaxID=46180 RepID=A0A7X0U5V5_9ACTN|nr:helix-turn-helix transcriptional regulator [Nonomuraea rubra]MBB6556258.1 transcriptional regulator with XRE-family HTH domain [Nonomuraea rubra]